MNEKQVFNYKGYEGSVLVSLEDDCLYGEVLFIKDTILYEASSVPELKVAFTEAVDAYLSDCKIVGKSPDKPFSGTLNVRIGPEKHRQLAIYANRKNLSINAAINFAIEQIIEVLKAPSSEDSYSSAPVKVHYDGASRLRVVK